MLYDTAEPRSPGRRRDRPRRLRPVRAECSVTYRVECGGHRRGAVVHRPTRCHLDIWHCDAAGVYSDATDPSFNTKGQRFLRGYQVTDANGKAAFTTIYPGWYQGRAVHIHFKIRTAAANGSGWMKNAQDGIYAGGGDKLLLKPTQSGPSFAATFDIGLA